MIKLKDLISEIQVSNPGILKGTIKNGMVTFTNPNIDMDLWGHELENDVSIGFSDDVEEELKWKDQLINVLKQNNIKYIEKHNTVFFPKKYIKNG